MTRLMVSPQKGPVMRVFEVFFFILHKLLNKQLAGLSLFWDGVTLIWRHNNVKEFGINACLCKLFFLINICCIIILAYANAQLWCSKC